MKSPNASRQQQQGTRRSGSSPSLLLYLFLALLLAGLIEIYNSLVARQHQQQQQALTYSNTADDASDQPKPTHYHAPIMLTVEQHELQKQQHDEPQQQQQNASARSRDDKIPPRVEWIATQDLNMPSDAFSATWWQSRERFLELDSSRIQFPEAASFRAILDRYDDVAMTVDWMHLSVEHLSRWWKTVAFDKPYRRHEEKQQRDPIAYHRILTNLLEYIQRVPVPDASSSLSSQQHQKTTAAAMPETIAVIAFMPYQSKAKPEWGRPLTVVNLAATLASLIQVECGRIVIVCHVGHEEESRISLISAIRLLQHSAFKNTNTNSVLLVDDENGVLHQVIHQGSNEVAVTAKTSRQEKEQPFLETVGATEIGFVAMDANYTTKRMRGDKEAIVPRAAVAGLHEAFSSGNSMSPFQQESWLGRASRDNNKEQWKYVYLTEPDLILQTRASVLPMFKEAMDGGKILVPHRFHSIPHERDLQGYKDLSYYLPALGPFQNVTAIHAPAAVVSTTAATKMATTSNPRGACCDGGKERPWQRHSKCSIFWHSCGFPIWNSNDFAADGKQPPYVVDAEELLQHHFRLFDYPLLRISSGSNLVSVAGSVHGRRCFPQPKGECPAAGSYYP